MNGQLNLSVSAYDRLMAEQFHENWLLVQHKCHDIDEMVRLRYRWRCKISITLRGPALRGAPNHKHVQSTMNNELLTTHNKAFTGQIKSMPCTMAHHRRRSEGSPTKCPPTINGQLHKNHSLCILCSFMMCFSCILTVCMCCLGIQGDQTENVSGWKYTSACRHVNHPSYVHCIQYIVWAEQ